MRARLRRRPAAGDDRGYSLIELVVAMGIMSIVMIVAFTGIAQIYSATNRAEGTSFARDQLGNTFRRLDKELRYATWVGAPGQVDGAWYLEYARAAGCRQLKLSGGTLTLASWTVPGAPGEPNTVAAELTLIPGIAPFTMYQPGDQPYASASAGPRMGKEYASAFYQVRLRFNATVGKVTLPFDTVYTALNTSRNTPVANDCRFGRP